MKKIYATSEMTQDEFRKVKEIRTQIENCETRIRLEQLSIDALNALLEKLNSK